MMWYRHRKKKKTWPIIWIFLGISAYTWHFHAFSLIWTTNCGYMTPDDGIAPSIEPSAHGLSKLSRRIPEKKNTGFFLYSVHKSRNGICIDGAIRYSQTGCVARQTRWRNSVIWAMHFATGVYIYIYRLSHLSVSSAFLHAIPFRLASIVPIPGMSLAPSFSMTGTVTTTVSGLYRMVQITQRVVDHGSSTNTSLTKQCRN